MNVGRDLNGVQWNYEGSRDMAPRDHVTSGWWERSYAWAVVGALQSAVSLGGNWPTVARFPPVRSHFVPMFILNGYTSIWWCVGLGWLYSSCISKSCNGALRESPGHMIALRNLDASLAIEIEGYNLRYLSDLETLKALGCSIPSIARVILRAWGSLDTMAEVQHNL